MYSEEFLMKLMGTRCPTGHEQEAALVWRQEARGISETIVRSDTHGNSVATMNPQGSFSVMLAGHIDVAGTPKIGQVVLGMIF